MGAVTIHLPTEVEEKVRQTSAAEGMSMSAWLAEAARKQLDERLPPPEFLALLGACPEFELPTRAEPWSSSELD